MTRKRYLAIPEMGWHEMPEETAQALMAMRSLLDHGWNSREVAEKKAAERSQRWSVPFRVREVFEAS